MTVRIGYIGSAHSVARLPEFERRVPGVVVRGYPYASPLDTAAEYRAALAENDVVCFSGILGHYHRDRSLDTGFPLFVGRFNQYHLVASLLHATTVLGLALAELSVDLPNEQVADAVRAEIGLALDPAQVHDYRLVYNSRFTGPVDVDGIVAFHRERAAGGARLAVTSVHAVYDRLTAAGVPVMVMLDSTQNEADLLARAAERVAVSRLEESLVAAVYLTTDRPAAASAAATARMAAVRGVLAGFASQTVHRLASWQHDGLELYYTTQGEVTAHLPALLGALAGGGPGSGADAVSVGIGVGRQVYESEDHALQALRVALTREDSSAFLVDEDSRVRGPLAEDGPAEAARHTDPWLTALAGRAAMHARSLARVLAFAEARDFRPFTAPEWAAASQSSARTAERTVRKLLDAGALVTVGQERAQDAGRPRAVYALSADAEARCRAWAASLA